MTIFEYVAVLVSIVVGLGMTHLLAGVGRMISGAGHWRVYWVHLVWVLYLFLYLVFFWWWEFKLAMVDEWTFGLYLFVILYAVLLYLLTVVLFPRGFPDEASFEVYYYSRRHWFFGLLIATYVVDVGDTLAKGLEHATQLGVEYWVVGVAAHIVLFVLAIIWTNRSFHAALAIALTLYLASWAFNEYGTIG